MAVLHEKLPCAIGFFRMRKKFKQRQDEDYASPIRMIASPKMIRGLSIPKAAKMGNKKTELSEHGPSPKVSPDVRIKNLRKGNDSVNRNPLRSAGSPNKKGLGTQYKEQQEVSESSGFSAALNNLSINPHQYTDENGNRALSPHKISRNNKMRRYEEQKV